MKNLNVRNKKTSENGTEDESGSVMAKPIPLIIGLGLWAYAVLFHMDMWGAIASGVGILFYGYSIVQGKVKDEKKKEVF